MLRLFSLALAAAVFFMAPQAQAQVTYYIQSAPYNAVSNFTACPLGGCAAIFTTSQRISGSFTISGALNPNMVDEIIDVRLGDLNLSDGQNTYVTDFSDFSLVAQTAQISTDASGNLTYFEFKFDKMNGAPIATNSPGDPKSYVTSLYLANTPGGGSFAIVYSNAVCIVRGDNTGGKTLGRGCAASTLNGAQGGSQASAPSVTISLTPPPAPVPTLSEWAMILFGTLLAGCAMLYLQRRQIA